MNIDLKIQSAVIKHRVLGIFNNGKAHLFDHRFGEEMSLLLRKIKITSYIYDCGKRYRKMIIHRNTILKASADKNNSIQKSVIKYDTLYAVLMVLYTHVFNKQTR